jgi:hypothetical protein
LFAISNRFEDCVLALLALCSALEKDPGFDFFALINNTDMGTDYPF